MTEFDVVTELRLQIWISFLERVLIKEVYEWIQTLVIRSTDPSTIIQNKAVVFVFCILNVRSGKQLCIVTTECRVERYKHALKTIIDKPG